MTDVAVKKEKQDSDSEIDDFLPELTKLLDEVKREEQVSSDESDFVGDLFRDEDKGIASDGTEDADIQKLQKLLELKKKELKETEESTGGSVEHDSRSSISTDTNNRKRRTHKKEAKDGHSGSRTKRTRNSVDERRRSGSKSLESQTLESGSNNQKQTPAVDEIPARIDVADDEIELRNLLKTADYDSDEEAASSDQVMVATSNAPPTYNFPTVFPMTAPIYDPACQMMGGIPPGSYPLMYNMGLQQSFYATNMGNMPMMGFGIPQMSIPTDQSEVQCLPVVNNAGFSGLPTFKRIKLEMKLESTKEEVDKSEASAEERRQKVFEACTTLLEQLEFPEQTGKFTFTSTVAKLNSGIVSNSVVQKITNVSYEFHSIGPKLNLADWGLREIGNRNADIAKKIAINADEYFSKILEKSNTIAGKLIKVEDAKADDNKEDKEMEIEEATLSSFLKNSMTQTDAVVCKECVARKRIVGHHIGVQATVYTSSIGSQTSPVIDDSACLTADLSVNQLKALYKFSSLIREPPKNTSVELYRLREGLMEIYNLSQRSHIGPVPNMSSLLNSSLPSTPHAVAPIRDPRFIPPGTTMPNLTSSAMQAPRHPQFNSYPPYSMQVPNNQSPAMQMPRHRPPTMQVPRHQFPAAQFPGYPRPSFRDTEYPPDELQDSRKSYGRGNHPR